MVAFIYDLSQGRKELEGLNADHTRLKDRVEKWEQFTAKEKECYLMNLKRLHITNEYAEMKNAIVQREFDHLKGQADEIKEELIGKTRQKIQILETDREKREKIYVNKVDLTSEENKGLFSKSTRKSSGAYSIPHTVWTFIGLKTAFRNYYKIEETGI